MNDLELQKAFAQYLVQLSGAKSEQELQLYVERLGKEGLQKVYQQFMAEMQQTQKPRIAKHGAKLNLIKKLSGVLCAPDEELTYYKVGGKFCKKCLKKQQENQGSIPFTPMSAKSGTKMVQDFKNSIESNKCGGKTKKKTKKGEDGAKLDNNTTPDNMKCGGKSSKMKKGAALLQKLNKK